MRRQGDDSCALDDQALISKESNPEPVAPATFTILGKPGMRELAVNPAAFRRVPSFSFSCYYLSNYALFFCLKRLHLTACSLPKMFHFFLIATCIFKKYLMRNAFAPRV